MAGLILCRGTYADKPYYISNMGINICSIEELCYYIYHNIYLVGQDLIDEGLITYIERELKEPDLARQLTFLTTENAGFSEIIITILRYADFYSDREIDALRETIDTLDLQNASERLKSRADSFLENRRYNSAIRNYETIVYGKRDTSLPMDFYGNVWHNMGVAYARMLCYQEARACFLKAYELNEREESEQAALFASVLCGASAEDEKVYMAGQELNMLMAQAEEEPGFAPVDHILGLHRDGKILEYREAADRLVEDWKLDYKSYLK